MLGRQFGKVGIMLREATDDLTAFADFPVSHWNKIWLTNALERVNKETNAAPTSSRLTEPAALAPPSRLSARRDHDEWEVSDRRYLSFRVAESAVHSYLRDAFTDTA